MIRSRIILLSTAASMDTGAVQAVADSSFHSSQQKAGLITSAGLPSAQILLRLEADAKNNLLP